MGVEEAHIGRAQSEGNFYDDKAEEGGEDLGGGLEEDMGDSGDFSESRSFSKDNSIVEGAMVHGGGDRAATSLEGVVADTWTSPSRGRQSIQRKILLM